MPQASELTADLELASTLQGLVQVWEQVYVLKMQRNRQSVVQIREFIDGLGQTFSEVRLAYREYLLSKGQVNQELELGTEKKTKNLAAVLLSASEKLSGEINQKVFDKFWQYALDHPEADLVIVGKLGKQLFSQRLATLAASTPRPQQLRSTSYRYFDISEEALSLEELKPVVIYLVDYRQVNVFYGKFQSFVSQQEAQSNISGQQLVKEGKSAALSQMRFLFEPSPQIVIDFFATQIFTALFKQTVHESHLAQIGSRIMTLEVTSGNIDRQLTKLELEQRKLDRRRNNRKQLRSLVSSSLW